MKFLNKKENPPLRVCALQWKTTGVAGLNSELIAMYNEGADRGHVWKVFETWPWVQKDYEIYGERQLIRGGDVYLTVDGKLSHHPRHAKVVADYINLNFDYLYLSGMVPHPNKAYGSEPFFYDFLRMIEIPMIGRICDGYAGSYRAWLELGLEMTPTLNHVTIAYSYRETVERYGIEGVHIPFYPEPSHVSRTEHPSLVWLSQWKNIKGIKQFVKALPDINNRITVDMYSNGIEYYQMRNTPLWQSVVGKDMFDSKFSGRGNATFHGYTALENIPDILSRSWAMADFQGMGRARYEVYNKGSINTTGIEALWYGCLPIVAENSIIPTELCLKVRAENIAQEINDCLITTNFATNGARQKLAKAYVSENFLASTVYDKIMGF